MPSVATHHVYMRDNASSCKLRRAGAVLLHPEALALAQASTSWACQALLPCCLTPSASAMCACISAACYVVDSDAKQQSTIPLQLTLLLQ